MPTAPSATVTILIVDDEPNVRLFMGRVLTNAGYITASAADGPEALATFETAGHVDLLVTDFLMPQMRGNELARRVRHLDPAVKVLYVSAYRDQLFNDKAVLWEDEAFLDKPFTMSGLVEAVSLLLHGQLDRSAPTPVASTASVPAPRQSLRVLLVEDNEADARLIVAELERTRRFEVQAERVDTSTTLTAALARESWDLILTDHTMPQLNAMAVLKLVRDRGLTVPRVLVSGTASAETAAAAMKIGADDFVSKRELLGLIPAVTRALDDVETRRARSSVSRLRLQSGQEFDVVGWTPDAAVLSGLVGLAPGHDHECVPARQRVRPHTCAFGCSGPRWRR